MMNIADIGKLTGCGETEQVRDFEENRRIRYE